MNDSWYVYIQLPTFSWDIFKNLIRQSFLPFLPIKLLQFIHQYFVFFYGACRMVFVSVLEILQSLLKKFVVVHDKCLFIQSLPPFSNGTVRYAVKLSQWYDSALSLSHFLLLKLRCSSISLVSAVSIYQKYGALRTSHKYTLIITIES